MIFWIIHRRSLPPSTTSLLAREAALGIVYEQFGGLDLGV